MNITGSYLIAKYQNSEPYNNISYIINGEVINDVGSLDLIGVNYNDWGQVLEQNMLYLIEHFSSITLRPTNMVEGQCWNSRSTYGTYMNYMASYDLVQNTSVFSYKTDQRNFLPYSFYFDTSDPLNKILYFSEDDKTKTIIFYEGLSRVAASDVSSIGKGMIAKTTNVQEALDKILGNDYDPLPQDNILMTTGRTNLLSWQKLDNKSTNDYIRGNVSYTEDSIAFNVDYKVETFTNSLFDMNIKGIKEPSILIYEGKADAMINLLGYNTLYYGYKGRHGYYTYIANNTLNEDTGDKGHNLTIKVPSTGHTYTIRPGIAIKLLCNVKCNTTDKYEVEYAIVGTGTTDIWIINISRMNIDTILG